MICLSNSCNGRNMVLHVCAMFDGRFSCGALAVFLEASSEALDKSHVDGEPCIWAVGGLLASQSHPFVHL